MAALIVSARPQQDASPRPLPWRRMAWVTWRQHRFALTGMSALTGALAACLWVAGLQLHHAYAAATSCHPASSIACEGLIGSFDGSDRVLANGYVLQVLPVLIGTFLGAPLLARELETGSFRFAWTQGFGPWRWTLAKLVALAVVVTAAAAAISVLLSWYYRPYFHPYFAGNPMSLTSESSPLAGGLFDLRGVAFAAWTLVAFAIGGLVGVLIPRVVTAIVVSLAAYAALAFAAGMYLRQLYLAPLLTSKLNVPGSALIVSQRWLTKGGEPVSRAVLSQVLQEGGPQLAGKGGVPQALGSWQYLVEHGYTMWTTYQPASRFWTFQWIEAGWLLALSVLLIATTVWLVHRRGNAKRRARPDGSRRRLRRVAATAGAILAVGLAVAGCGDGSSTPGVATVAKPATSSAAGGGARAPGLLAYAACMRAHGVPGFPDPTGSGGISKRAVIKAQQQVSNAQAEAAQSACQRLQPNGGQQSPAERAQHLGDLLAFAGCIRTHGIPNFPDPTSAGQITHRMLAAAGIDLHRAAVLQAADACVGVTHGALTKAAVARFAAGH
jgi:hypothetical protein